MKVVALLVSIVMLLCSVAAIYISCISTKLSELNPLGALGIIGAFFFGCLVIMQLIKMSGLDK